MRVKLAAVLIAFGLAAAPAFAETIEVRMLNRGQNGSMVFEPDYVELKPGDSIKFRVGHKSHNAASIEGMVPDGYAGFKGQINEEIEVTFDTTGFYGIKCSPHFAMGMVMLIKVGEVELTEAFRKAEVPGRARGRFDAIFARMDQAKAAQ
ncbi:pseudoazurin [Ensifer adhaerens]|uniref:Pseudoazurin n=1 Tax=Ensifer adhaerens TaxID=106592 RepID=A0ACC5SXI2_ENSAD|nr:pseudoazurin [Ensifer adhaerens]MBP1873379.1 pseudoazurin [Ensifer adhaerens]